ncbi:phosphatase PAP2 family protein [Streptosporangium sp. NPDC002544]|uniref:phosphatase PAP2 family protein n=1 Tax=Streptosporangium sp. NPDC002544 TaxID=3154538 RepID=UPI00332B08A9
MADQRVNDVGAPGQGPGGEGERGGLAWVVTEVAAPQYVAIALPPVTGLLAHGWTGAMWGLLAAALCAGVPVGVIAVGVRRGRLDSMHLVDRKSRRGPMLAGLITVAVGLVLLALLDAPAIVTATAAVMLGWVLVMGSITMWWKISFHTGVAAGAAVVLAHVLPAAATLAVGAALVGVIGWARVRVSHHTPTQTIAGAAAGAGVAWAVLTLTL